MSALQLSFLPERIITPDENERDREHFPTPPGIARYAVRRLLPIWTGPRRIRVLDPGAGTGVWGRAVLERWPRALVCGVDLPGVQRARGYSMWRSQDFLEAAHYWTMRNIRFDVVLGNPWYSGAEEVFRVSYDLLLPGGYLVFFLRLAFWAGQKRGLGLWRDYPPYDIAVSSRRPSFTGDGVSDTKTEYALFVWRKGFRGRFRDPFDYENEETW